MLQIICLESRKALLGYLLIINKQLYYVIHCSEWMDGWMDGWMNE